MMANRTSDMLLILDMYVKKVSYSAHYELIVYTFAKIIQL